VHLDAAALGLLFDYRHLLAVEAVVANGHAVLADRTAPGHRDCQGEKES
jgi:hypothetical protein